MWFMRQAGRSLPEYRALRGDGPVLEAISKPELAAEFTLQPVRRYGVDAAVLFSDIVVPLAAIGFGVDVTPGLGPVVESPFRGGRDLSRLRPLEPDTDVPYVMETIRILTAELKIPIVGFAGGPFTLASYLIEGGASRTYSATKALMHSDPQTWKALTEALADLSLASLRAQVSAGVEAVQVFDSWAGALSPSDYKEMVLPATRRIFGGLADSGVPTIHFGVGAGQLVELMAEAGPDVLGVDWRVPLEQARRRAPRVHAVQGNLDPAICLAPWEVVAKEARKVLADAGSEGGHVFNLGHGVLPGTDPGILAGVVELVHEETRVA